MSFDDAIKILYQVTGQVPLIRADQEKVTEAFAVISALAPKKE